MSLKNIARREVVKVRPNATVAEASKLMEERHIGSVVVSNNGNAIGMLTDRDLILRVVNKGLDPKHTPVESVMSRDVVTLNEDMGLYDALELMRDRPMRRFLIVDGKGHVEGIFTLDDIMYLIGREMADVASIIETEMPEGAALSTEARNKALARRMIEELWNQGKLAVVDELYAKDYVGHGLAATGLGTSLDALKSFVKLYRSAFPDIQLTIEEQIASGNKIVQRWTARGTHKGELMGIAPTDKAVSITGTATMCFSDGKCIESWNHWNTLDMLQQLGVAPSFGG